MILRITVNTANLNINNQTVRVVRVYNRNVPAGITEAEFTQKGSLLAGSGAGTFGELAPGSAGQYPTPDPAEPLGLKWETPTFTVNDTTNHLINGGFLFAQDQDPATLTTKADGGYGADQWKLTRENAELQYIRQDATSETGLTSRYYGQFKKITNAGKFLVCQPLIYTDSIKFRGKDISFQVQMKASAAKTIKIAIVQLQTGGTADTLPTLVSAWGADGTDPTLGTNLATIGTPTTCSVTTAWQTFQVTGTFPATAKNLIVMVWTNADFAANDTLSLAEAGLYFGTSQRSWTPRPEAQELSLCEMYYEKSYELNTAPGTASVVGGLVSVVAISAGRTLGTRYRTRKRTASIIQLWSYLGTAAKIALASSGEDIGTTMSGYVPSENGVYLIFDSGAGLTAGTGYIFHYAASARL